MRLYEIDLRHIIRALRALGDRVLGSRLPSACDSDYLVMFGNIFMSRFGRPDVAISSQPGSWKPMPPKGPTPLFSVYNRPHNTSFWIGSQGRPCGLKSPQLTRWIYYTSVLLPLVSIVLFLQGSLFPPIRSFCALVRGSPPG
jgi:hypothetical protein